jgi:serine/threonine-protein kinase RsbW
MPTRRRLKLARVSTGRGPVQGRTRRVRLRMPSQRDAVAAMVDQVLEAVRDVGFGPGRRHDLAVAVSEALSNAAVHGNRLRPEADVLITVEVTPKDRAVIDVKDGGEGFDVTSLVDPTEPHKLLSPAGRGVYLMKRLMDEVRYNRKGNRVRLTMERRRPRRRST